MGGTKLNVQNAHSHLSSEPLTSGRSKCVVYPVSSEQEHHTQQSHAK